MRIWIIVFLIFGTSFNIEKEKFKVEIRDTGTWLMIFDLIDEEGELIRTLDTSKYFSIDLINEGYGYFATFQIIDSTGFHAIDSEENILFEVHNRSYGEPNPDYLYEDKIRMVGADGKIGFANIKGEIIIPPVFESVTSFHNGKAIIGEDCKMIRLHGEGKADCHHYIQECKIYGFINDKGDIIERGEFSFEEASDKINWKPQDF